MIDSEIEPPKLVSKSFSLYLSKEIEQESLNNILYNNNEHQIPFDYTNPLKSIVTATNEQNHIRAIRLLLRTIFCVPNLPNHSDLHCL